MITVFFSKIQIKTKKKKTVYFTSPYRFCFSFFINSGIIKQKKKAFSICLQKKKNTNTLTTLPKLILLQCLESSLIFVLIEMIVPLFLLKQKKQIKRKIKSTQNLNIFKCFQSTHLNLLCF